MPQSKISIEIVIQKLRDEHGFMSEIERSKTRTKKTHEFFTPVELIHRGLKYFSESKWEKTKTFLDTSCGDGQILSEIIIKKMKMGSTYQEALDTVYGVDLMPDNCIKCIQRLYGAFEQKPVIKKISEDYIPLNWKSAGLTAIFEVNGKICNIVCADGLKYEYNFGEASEPKYIGAGERGLFIE